MTQLHFSLDTKEIQNLIDKSVENDLSKTILTTVFEHYQRNEKASLTSMLVMCVSGVSTRKVSQVVEELYGK